jgi:hypothetical protein
LLVALQRIRAAANWLPETAYRMRREFFCEKTEGVFSQPPKSRAMHETMATDPSFMVDMMKKNLTGLLPQIVMGTAVSFFFSGFVMGKIPFSLSPRFRPMLQRGVDLASLDVSYFTSLSYYFALLFAMRGPFSLVFRENTLDETEMMRRQMNPMAGGAGFDAAGMFKAEKQVGNLRLYLSHGASNGQGPLVADVSDLLVMEVTLPLLSGGPAEAAQFGMCTVWSLVLLAVS